MRIRIKTVRAIAAANLRQLVPAYIVTAAFFLVGIYNLTACMARWSDNYYVDMANYLYVLAVMAPIITVSRNYQKMMYLNGSKKAFYLGALLSYCAIAGIVSLACIVFHVTTKAIFDSRLIIKSLVDVFGWWRHGIILAFMQQFAFVLLAEIFIHTLTSIQTRWYGWLIDVLLVLILCIFIPIQELRSLLAAFFKLIIFNPNPPLQIISCLLLAAILYLIYHLILQRKKV